MRIRSLVTAATLAVGLASPAADAGTLTSATWTQGFPGSLAAVTNFAITVTNSGTTCTDTNPFRVPGTGFVSCPTAGLQATGSSTESSYNVSLTMPLFQMQVFTTGGVIPLATRVTLSGAQYIAGIASAASATPGVAGMITVGGAQHTMNITMASMWVQPEMGTLVVIPLSIGRNARFSWTFSVLGSYHDITIDFYGWTPGTLSFTDLTSFSMALPDAIVMGSFALEPSGPGAGAGTITLVAPSKLSIDGPAAQRRTVSLTTLKLSFVPEPGTLLLLGAGALALLRFVRRR